MAGVLTEDSGGGDRLTGDQRCESVDSLAEWRSLEQVENGTPSTSPPNWDTDDDDDGLKPTELYGEFTWKIEKFSTINKRELRSNAFEVGGYKWYILIYPQGCDVCNHLSLFLCVAHHDKLLPGWSHFAQFTIAVENKDPRKVKYSDTLHRFWKKEHDWGWKKFMELSKVFDGFIDSEDTLTIRAKVQVIREKADRPFRCLDCEYRRELLRVYLSNAEQICRRFVDERRGKLSNLIEDKVRWSSFRAFWLGIDQNVRRSMSREKADAIFKVVVKHFFIEKEVTSTLVMDSLYSGVRVLLCQSKNNSRKSQLLEMEDFPSPMVLVEKDMFVLADDVLQLLERAAWEPLPHQPLLPKDEKASQCRSKDGGSGEDGNRDSVERDEKRLTELGRRTVEIFALTHIFSRIEVAYQEAVALRRQEELIREEEAAGHAENELRLKRGASQKEKRSKKKQAKKRKSKDKLKNEKCDITLINKHQPEGHSDGKIVERLSSMDTHLVDRIDVIEDVSNVSDSGDEVADTVPPEVEDRDTEIVKWDTYASEVHPNMEASSTDIQNGQLEKRSASFMDDSSSTCSTDSVPSVLMGAACRGNPMPKNTSRVSPKKGKNQRNKDTFMQIGSTNGRGDPPSVTATSFGGLNDATGNSRTKPAESDGAVATPKDKKMWLDRTVEKQEFLMVQKKTNVEDLVDLERPSKLTFSTPEPCSSSTSRARKLPLDTQQKKQLSDKTALPNTSATSSAEQSSNGTMRMQKSVSPASRSNQLSTSKSEAQKPVIPVRSTMGPQVVAVSRPLSAPLIPGRRPTGATTAFTAQPVPQLSRSVSAAGRLGTESPSAQSYIPQSYRNAIMGKTLMEPSISSGFILPTLSCSVSSAPVLPPLSGRRNQSSSRSSFTFGPVSPGPALHQQRDDSSSILRNGVDAVERLSLYDGSQSNDWSQEVPCITPRSAYGAAHEEFPHLDIINELLDEEQGLGMAAYRQRQQLYTQHHSLNRQYTFPARVSLVEASSSLSSRGRLHSDDSYDTVYAHDSRKYWEYLRPDLAMQNGGLSESNGYLYQGMDCENSTSAVNGFSIYPSANRP